MKNIYQCKVCLETFSLLRYLRKHVTIPAVEDHQPNKCQSYYSGTGNLQQNLKANHKIIPETPTEELNYTTKGQGVHSLSTRNQEKTSSSKDDDCRNIEDEHACLKFEPDEKDELYFFDPENPVFPYNDIANNLPQKFVNTEDETKEDNQETNFLMIKEQVKVPIKQAKFERHNSQSREILIDTSGLNTTKVNSLVETTICKNCKLAFTSHEDLCVHYETLHKLSVVILDRIITNQRNSKCKRANTSNSEKAIKKIRSHKCSICSRTFTTFWNLKNHKSSVHDGKIFNCNVCQKTFHRLDNLKHHKLVSHDGFRYKCNICAKKFSQLTSLKRHISGIHDNIRFKCDICQKEFNQLGNLKEHKLNIHEHLRYECNSCSTQFNSARSLGRHKISVHEGVCYKCELCDKQFTQGKSLREHKATVHGGVRHKCDNCPKVYSYVRNLKKHMSVAHGEQRNSANSALKNF